jgi:hypothetical protein
MEWWDEKNAMEALKSGRREEAGFARKLRSMEKPDLGPVDAAVSQMDTGLTS